ncbi:MAG TPA: hypothetical protein VMA83_02730 [Solirubrobacteraceae bacterium]|nr:hypothetical protein [Solirubrobacteraceae bacterium]
MSERPGAVCVAVSCPGAGPDATTEVLEHAGALGRALAGAGATVVCGGLGGAMDSLAAGVRAGGGTCIGLLPGADRSQASAALSLALPTGLGQARNAVLATAGEALIAVGRGYGTLSEVAFALRLGRPVVLLASWDVPGAIAVADAASAAAAALQAVAERRG